MMWLDEGGRLNVAGLTWLDKCSWDEGGWMSTCVTVMEQHQRKGSLVYFRGRAGMSCLMCNMYNGDISRQIQSKSDKAQSEMEIIVFTPISDVVKTFSYVKASIKIFIWRLELVYCLPQEVLPLSSFGFLFSISSTKKPIHIPRNSLHQFMLHVTLDFIPGFLCYHFE